NDPKTVVRSLSVLAPVAKLDQQSVRVQTVPKAALDEVRKETKQRQAVAVERQKTEQTIRAQGNVPVRPTDPPRKTKLELPKVVRATTQKAQVPALPTIPQHVEKPLPKTQVVNPVHVPAKPITIDH